MKTAVLDASALLALFFDEPGAEKVESLLQQAAEADKPLLIAAVNWAEVLYKMQRKSGAKGLAGAREFERTMPLEVAPLDRELAESAAQFKAAHDLGLADAFAAALAKSKKAELVTADTEFKALEREIKIGWLK
ncbi:MAG: VapC toxin family PIN domain ribonuclease [Verrucomicrobia bacterium]|nr:MAG: VapC toxin family PIN domain ribonuclease [Verrucomicrobiota bacterium]